MLADDSARTGWRSGGLVRYEHDEAGAAERAVFDKDRAALSGGCRASDRQSQASAETVVGEALELGKNALTRFDRDPGPGVAHFDAYCTVLNAAKYRDGGSRWSVPRHVFQDIRQRLLHQAGVESRQWQRVGDIEAD